VWIHRRHEAGEEVIAGLKGGAAESKVQDTGVEVLSQGVPGADGRTSVEHRRAISVDAALAGSLEHLNFRLIPLHSYSVSDQRRAAKRSFDEMRRSRGTEPTYFGMSAMLFTCAWTPHGLARVTVSIHAPGILLGAPCLFRLPLRAFRR